MHGKKEKGNTADMRELAQWLGGHYNANYKEEGFESPWRKGPTELGIMADKEFGPHHSHLVKELMSMKGGETKLERAARRSHERRQETEEGESTINRSNEPKMASALRKGQKTGWMEDKTFEDILRLSGLSNK